MPVLETAPEIAQQAQEAENSAAFAIPEADPHAEASQDMTSEQAIKVCPYLGRLAAQDPELARQKAQEYIADPGKIAQMHPEQEGEKEQAEDQESFWEDLEAEFSADEITSENIEDEESELFKDAASEPEPQIAEFDRENAIAQEEAKHRQSLDNRYGVHREHIKSDEGFDHDADIDGIVSSVIAANPQACQDFRNGNAEALDILVKKAMKLSESA